MKVLHITNNYPTIQHPIFGIFVKEQIDSLTSKGVINEVFFINGREKGSFEYFKSIIKINILLKEKKYDIIHCHHTFSAMSLILSGGKKRNKVIVSFQSDPVNEFNGFFFKFIKNKVNLCIFKNNSKLLINNKNGIYLANGVNIIFFKNIDKQECYKFLNLNPTKIYILFVSSNFIRKEKRYDIFKLVIETLKTKYYWNNIDELLLINVDRSIVPYYFNAASLHLLTSDFEGSPNSVKESMACNIPVVTTPVGNVKEMLSGAENCFVSESFDVEELAFLCDKALKTKGNPRDLIINKNLDINSVAYKLKSIYENLLNNNLH